MTLVQKSNRLPAGVLAIAGLFAVGVLASGASCLALLFPESALSNVWCLNPQAGTELRALGWPAVALMTAVCVACALACSGLLRRRVSGYWTALALLAFNGMSDLVAAIARADPRTLIGVPIAIALILYLRQGRIAGLFVAIPRKLGD